jgi:dipeptidyl aminopeptidase/acylaminoacyl peptidase
MDILKRSMIAMLFLLLFVVWSSAEEKKYPPEWTKVGTLPNSRSIDDYHWCGDSAIIYFHVTYEMYDDFRGGIMLYDVKKGKRHWISKDSDTRVGFCNSDGSVVFWYSKNGLMAYDVKTGRARSTGIDLTKFKASIRPSLINNTILVVGVDRNRLASSLSNNLQGWRILQESLAPAQSCDQSNLARDGDYFYNWGKDIRTGKCRLSIYDANGNLQRSVDNLKPIFNGSRQLIISGGYYVLDKSNHLIKKIDVNTGEITAYTVPDKTQGFDINTKGELIHWISKDKGANIWFANKLGDKPYLLEYEGSAPMFSPSGDHVYFHVGNEGIVILKK